MRATIVPLVLLGALAPTVAAQARGVRVAPPAPSSAFAIGVGIPSTDAHRRTGTDVLGRLLWRGELEGRVEIAWRGAVAWVLPVAGAPPRGVSWEVMGAPLPAAASSQCDVVVIAGRARAWLRELPSAENAFTARVVVERPARSAAPVTVELRWR